jgi:hypothetical protein
VFVKADCALVSGPEETWVGISLPTVMVCSSSRMPPAWRSLSSATLTAALSVTSQTFDM